MARVLISKAQADLTDYGVYFPPGMDAGQLQAVRRTLQLLNSNTNPFQRDKNRTTQSDLSNFGVPRQEIAVRQPMPSAEEMEQIVREGDIALTPHQYATKVPLIERQHYGTEEREGDAGKRFGMGMGTEGALAQGVIAREHPQVAGLDPRLTPFLRDYYSRQSTLPEHLWDYHTEGPYYDEQGNILPGQVPPVDAIKIMGAGDIASMGTREGYGLKPVPHSRVNRNWEEDIKLEHRFPPTNIGFVGNLSERDIVRNAAANTGPSRGVVGIRGFGRPQDKAFARGRVAEGIEGGFTAPIPPERLVGVMPSTQMDADLVRYKHALSPLYHDEISFEQKLQQLVSEGEISPMDAIYASIRHRTKLNQAQTPLGRAKDAAHATALGVPYVDKYYPKRLDDLRETDAGGSFSSPARVAMDKVEDEYKTALPFSWQEGVFGFENPLLTEEEKKQYIEDINETGWKKDDYDLEDYKPEELPILYPKQAGVRYL